jgi:DNA-directed RNA polymerase subunit M/transcription elongation factor TFIIS
MIAFNCSNCRLRIKRHDSEALTQIACPGCGQQVQVPEVRRRVRELVPASAVHGKLAAEQPAKTIRCLCPHCQAVVKAPGKAAGTRAPCPRCGLKVEIPVPKAESLGEVVAVVAQSAPAIHPIQQIDQLLHGTSEKSQPPAPVTTSGALIQVVCSRCQAILFAPANSVGVSIPCPRCRTAVQVTQAWAKRWYVNGRGPGDKMQVYGPFSLPELQHFAREGRLLPGDLVCAEGSDNWVPASQVKNLFAPESLLHSARSTPLPPPLPPPPDLQFAGTYSAPVHTRRQPRQTRSQEPSAGRSLLSRSAKGF